MEVPAHFVNQQNEELVHLIKRVAQSVDTVRRMFAHSDDEPDQNVDEHVWVAHSDDEPDQNVDEHVWVGHSVDEPAPFVHTVAVSVTVADPFELGACFGDVQTAYWAAPGDDGLHSYAIGCVDY